MNPMGATDPARPHRTLQRRSARRAFLVVFVIHTGLALWAWSSGQPGLRTASLVWIDLPVSLIYLHAPENRVLIGSLLLGGIQWGLLAAAATLILGWVADRRGGERQGPREAS